MLVVEGPAREVRIDGAPPVRGALVLRTVHAVAPFAVRVDDHHVEITPAELLLHDRCEFGERLVHLGVV